MYEIIPLAEFKDSVFRKKCRVVEEKEVMAVEGQLKLWEVSVQTFKKITSRIKNLNVNPSNGS